VHPNASAPRILIVDDHASFRRTARALLEERRYIVVGEAASGGEATRAATRVALDGVLLDVRLGAENGFVVCAALTRAFPRLSVVLASSCDYGEFSELIDSSGACGFVLKSQLATTNLARFWPC
jgi:DNA-binding NarL/FixJ family response regulator